PGGRPPAGVAAELYSRVGPPDAVVLVAGEAVVEQLQGDGDLVRPKQAGGRGEPLKPCALRVADGPERAAHAPPWRLARRAARPRRCGAPATRRHSRRRGPCATGRRRRSGRDWD